MDLREAVRGRRLAWVEPALVDWRAGSARLESGLPACLLMKKRGPLSGAAGPGARRPPGSSGERRGERRRPERSGGARQKPARFQARALAAGALALAAGLLLTAAPAAAQDRLLTHLSATVDANELVLAWTVDEARAHRLIGFRCVYRSPSQLRTGVGDVELCNPPLASANARSLALSGLPEYGEYAFEVTAETDTEGPAIPWPARALRVRVAVPDGSAAVAAGGRPLAETCGPSPGSASGAAGRAWSVADIVTDTFLLNLPGWGWFGAGEAARRPPGGRLGEPADLATGDGPRATMADAHLDTKALLRPGAAGGHVLRLHTSYPFLASYAFDATRRVAGWNDAGHAAAWPELFLRRTCPPERWGFATHDVALALATAAGDRALKHAAYGWWAVSPVGLLPERLMCCQGGLSQGAEAAPGELPAAGARWRGRTTGHVFAAERRWALSGDIELRLTLVDGAPAVTGRIDNVRLAPLDPKTLAPLAGAPATRWNALTLAPVLLDGAAFRGGALAAGARPDATRDTPMNTPAADGLQGDYAGAFHGPGAAEAAGAWRLWTPLEDIDPSVGRSERWRRQAAIVGGFGALRVAGEGQ